VDEVERRGRWRESVGVWGDCFDSISQEGVMADFGVATSHGIRFPTLLLVGLLAFARKLISWASHHTKITRINLLYCSTLAYLLSLLRTVKAPVTNIFGPIVSALWKAENRLSTVS